MRVRVRLPAQRRPLVLMVPDGATFAALKARACAKLGVSGCAALLLGSSAGCAHPEAEARNAPELEGMDEVSPEDTLILVPLKGDMHANVIDPEDAAGGEDEAVGDADDEDGGEEDGPEDEGEGEGMENDGVEHLGEQDRESVLRRRFTSAQADGRVVDLTLSDDDDAEQPRADGAGSSRGAGQAGSAGGKRRRSAPKAAAKATLEAVLEEEEAVAPSAAAATAASAEEESDEARHVKERIRKMLTRGLHPATPEHEAQAAMRLANKLLQRHQLSKADVLASADGTVPEALQGGSARVHLRSTKDGKPAKTKQWIHDVARAVGSNFEVSYYYESWHGRAGSRCDFVFYGVAANATLAAFAFAAAFNRCAALAAEHTPPAGEFAQHARCGLTSARSAGAYTLAARGSYLAGLASGLRAGVRERMEHERRAAAAKIAAARAKAAAGEAWQSSSDSEGHVSDAEFGGDGEPTEPAQLAAKSSAGESVGGGASVSAVDALAKLEREETLRSALVTHTKKVAEGFLQQQSIKLSHAKKTFTRCEYRHASFVQGEADGKHIDVNQRAITTGRRS